MALNSFSAIIAGMQVPRTFLKSVPTTEAVGIMHSLLYAVGMPGPAVAPAPGLAGEALTTYGGQIPYLNPVAGESKLACLEAHCPIGGTVLVCDRLWHNSGINVTQTTAQTINSVAYPPRDTLGLVNGHGVLVGLEASSAIGGGSVTNTTLSYTNSSGAGTSGRTATIPSWPATAVAGTFVPFMFGGAGDIGHRSIQSLTLGTSYVSGALHLVAYRVLATLGLSGNVGASKDAVQMGFPLLRDNTVPFLLWLPSATTPTTLQGSVAWSQG